jgi:hypothetical protein
MAILSPRLTATPNLPATYNVGMAETFSWVPIEGAGRPLYARANYITNFEDFTISLSAAELSIESISIKDGNSGRVADVEDTGNGLNALRVLTQDLEPQHDTVSLADIEGNNVTVTTSTSSLNVNITNWVTSLSTTILNPVTAINATISNPVTSISVNNLLSSLNVTVLNPITAFTVINPVTAVNVLNPLSAFTVLNPVTSMDVYGELSITNTVSSLILNPVTSTNVFGSISLQDLNNHPVTVTTSTSSLNVNVTNPIVATVSASNSLPITFAASTNFDAFGRLRTSSPLTLFDSSHRYKDNNLWCTLTSVGATTSFNQNQGLVELTVNALSGSSVIRETTKVFSYQPGKSLLIMNTFILAPSATNLRQRVGYFGEDNGIYFQLDGSSVSLVERSLVNGSPSMETIVPLSAWNGDKLDGTGPSGFKLDVTKAQIQWMDVEWLGVGTVRVGFVINGQFILCHSFHHSNLIVSTYITTASLPLRCEITNKGTTDSSRTLKQICSTVISEGGYELRGLQQAISIPIISPITFAATNTYYPILSLRLKTSPDRMDAIVILTALSILGKGNGINYNWQVRASGVTTGGTWTSAGDDSAVEYNISGTTYAGGRILASGFLNASNQGSPNLDILKEALFKFQLERNNLTKTPYELTLVASTDTSNGSGMFASIDWEEISR